MEALRAWREACERGEDAPRAVVLTAVRFTLEELGALHPGRSVEVRVPPAGAVQILPGTTWGPSCRSCEGRGGDRVGEAQASIWGAPKRAMSLGARYFWEPL